MVDEAAGESLEGVGIIESKDHHCRWIVGKGGEYGLAVYCGKSKVKGSSYCQEHDVRAHVSRPARGIILVRGQGF